MKNIPKVDNKALSDELYTKCMEKAKQNPGLSATQWIHLADAVSRKTITPLEAYEAINLGYVPENLRCRESIYFHLL